MRPLLQRSATKWVLSLALVGMVGLGLASFLHDLRLRADHPAMGMMNFIRATASEGDIYLIPPKLQDFRLRAKAPAFVDFKSIPYRDVEVLQWWDRLKLARHFYRDRVEYIDCGLIEKARRMERITHIILGPEQLGLQCPEFQALLYEDEDYQVFQLQPASP